MNVFSNVVSPRPQTRQFPLQNMTNKFKYTQQSLKYTNDFAQFHVVSNQKFIKTFCLQFAIKC